MQSPSEQTTKLNLSSEDEVFALIIGNNHPFKRINDIIDFSAVAEPMRATYSTLD